MPITTTGPERTKSSILLKAAADLAPKLTSITTRNALIQHLAAVAGHTPVQFTIRDAFEMLECAMVGHILGSGQLAEFLLPHIIGLHHRLPTQTVRSEVQVCRQQFSTPAPIALFAQSRAAITANDIMLEPSAGTGLLATEAVRLNAALHLNELDPQRRALVSGLFPEAAVTGFDGAEIAARWQGRVPTVIVMNPPFSRNADGYEDSFTALRHLHSAHKCLAPGGRLVAILPSWIDRAGRNAASLAKMTHGASIIERYALGEGCFAKHGTSVATTLLVIDKVPGLAMVHNQSIAALEDLIAQPRPLPRAALEPGGGVLEPAPKLFSGFTRKTIVAKPDRKSVV